MSAPTPSQTARDMQREDLRFRLLRALDTDPDLSQRGLALETGVSLGAANALLNAAIGAGLVEIANAERAPAKFQLAYTLSQAGRDEMTRLAGGYFHRRRAEQVALGMEIAALEARFGLASDG